MNTTATATITIRRASDLDAAAIEHLAALDSARVPAGRLLVAAAGDDILAAVSTETGAVIADPFTPTADLVDLLRLRAERLRGPTRVRRAGALRPRLA